MDQQAYPINWLQIELDKLIESESSICYGVLKPGEQFNTGIPMLRVKDINKNYIDLSDVYRISDELDKEFSRSKLNGDEVLISVQGTVGRVAIADENCIGANISRTIAKIPLANKRLNKWVRYFLLSPQGQEIILANSGGTTRASLNIGDLKKINIPLPSFFEQHQTVNKLDELLAQVDSIKTRLDVIPNILKRFRQSVLANAVSGKLTEDWRKQNSPSNPLLTWPSAKEIDAAFDIPQEWKGVTLGSISERVSVGHVGKTTEYYTDETKGVPFFRSQNVRPGSISLEGLAYITEDFHNSLKKSQLKPGDLLVVRVGANRGDACVLPDIFERLNCANIVFARPKNGLSAYLNIYFQSPIARDLLIVETVGGAQGVINTKSVERAFLALPSVEEQTEIVSRVEQLFAYTDQIEQRVKDAQVCVNHQTQSILAKAFRGELTADWRAQNPDLISGENSAEALLKRIQLERAVHVAGGKVTKVKKKPSETMTPKQIISVYEALRVAGKPLSGQELLASAGYPTDASTQQLEQFFLDIRQQLELKTIIRNRRDNSDQDWFELSKSEG